MNLKWSTVDAVGGCQVSQKSPKLFPVKPYFPPCKNIHTLTLKLKRSTVDIAQGTIVVWKSSWSFLVRAYWPPYIKHSHTYPEPEVVYRRLGVGDAQECPGLLSLSSEDVLAAQLATLHVDRGRHEQSQLWRRLRCHPQHHQHPH